MRLVARRDNSDAEVHITANARALGRLDRTDGGKFDHYSAADVAAALHAKEGADHE